MKQVVRVLIWNCLVLAAWTSYAQSSINLVKFQVTYDLATSLYTAWVVPQYGLPNANSSDSTEQGGTAQFTIKVPASFVISGITDVHGTWEKNPLKLGPGVPGQNWSGLGLDPATNYYVIGKSPTTTNYGKFTSGIPVALFTFRGNGCFGPISPLEPGNLFITQADQRYSLNVANSFYSLSGQPKLGNQAPLEQFETLAGPPAQCSELQANPDSQTLTAGTSISIPVLANDTRNAQPVIAASVIVTVAIPNSGTATVNGNGTISYVSAAGYTGPVSFTYTLCDQLQTTICTSAVVSLTVLSAPAQPADLSITKQVSQSSVAVGGSVSFTLTVQNLGPGSAIGVSAVDSLIRNSPGVLQGIPAPSLGSFNATTGLWTIGILAANEVATLVLTISSQAQGVLINTASVTASGSPDPNLTNNVSSACTSVPVQLCAGGVFTTSVPANFQDVHWLRNGSPFATGNSVSITQIGVYTVTSANGACPLGGCCPIIVESVNCCPPNRCIPFVITRVR